MGLLLILSMLIVPTEALVSGENPNDDFNDNLLDTNKWLPYIFGYGSVAETNQELQIELFSNNTGSTFTAGVMSNWSISGDFDIQVDYRLITWPEQNGIRLGLEAGAPTARGAPDVVERVSAEPEWGVGEVYLTHFSDEVQAITPTNHTFGKLRLVRTNDTMSGYYFDGTEWILLHSAPTSTSDGPVTLKIWGHNSTPGVLIAFDNFQINYGQIVELSEDLEVYSPETDPYFVMNVTYVRGYPHVEPVREMLRKMAQNLAGLGVEVRLHFVEWPVLRIAAYSGKLYEQGGYDSLVCTWLIDPEKWDFGNVTEVAEVMRIIHHSSNMPGMGGTNHNVYMWNNTESDELLDAAVASTDPNQTESLLHHWQSLYREEQPAAITYHRSDPVYGWLVAYGIVAFNMLHPIFGTGVETPLGQSNQTRASEAARYVRQAISHTIDRQWIVENLASEWQPAEQGITPVTRAMAGFNPSLQPYSLNLTEARRLLSLAGYGMTVTGSSPISLWVTDLLGRHVGVDPETGNVVIEIPWAYYSGVGTKPQVVYIPWPEGEYTIQVTGTETGSFTLSVTQITEQTFTGVVTTNTTYVYTSTVSPWGAETATPKPTTELNNMKSYINAIPDEAFVTNPDQLRGALNHKIDEVIWKIENGSYEEAINKLTNDIYPKLTGVRYDYYASGGVKAWVIDPSIQNVLQKFLKQIVEEIEQMQAL
jgi:ABC-type transport system substrate-binding protein